MLQQGNITPQVLLDKIQQLWREAPKLKEKMRHSKMQNGAENVAQVIFEVLEGK